MEKRLVLAIALSLLVMLSWSALMPKSQLIDNKVVMLNNGSKQLPLPASIADNPAKILTPVISETAAEVIKFQQDSREIVFDPAKAVIVEINFKNNLEHRLPLKLGFFNGQQDLFKLSSRTSDTISFVYEDKNQRIIKSFFIPKDSYTIDLEITTQNLSSAPLLLNTPLILGRLDLTSLNKQARFQDIYISGKEKAAHYSANKDLVLSEVKLIGLRDQYFCAIIEPVNAVTSGYVKKISPQESEVGLLVNDLELKPGTQIGHLYHIYLGPQDLKILNALKPEWTGIIYYGFFDFIAQLILQLLGFFYSLVHNWGWAIILLSLAVYFMLFPLSIKQMRAMKEMQLLQPKIEALRQELKDNPQKLNKEIMELYKEHKVNPLGGCLPLLLQMPIFFALYQALIRSVALRGAHFLWIKDLSSPDKLFTLKTSLPLFGNQINILPILMAIGMFIQQKISTTKATGDAAQQQKIMAIIMPVMFGVIFYQMPSGLVLYWFVNSALMLAYQFKVNQQK